MKQALIGGRMSMDWLFKTHLKHRPDRAKWKSAMIFGNEDSPDKIWLFEKRLPLLSDPYEEIVLFKD